MVENEYRLNETLTEYVNIDIDDLKSPCNSDILKQLLAKIKKYQ